MKRIHCKRFYTALFILALTIQQTFAACLILTSDQQTASPAQDGLYLLLSQTPDCPQHVFAFRQLLKQSGLTLATTMVANRGFHNPALGSFSLFETAQGATEHFALGEGEFFFGHFTGVNDHNQLIADQTPELNSLMIEALAWDNHKQGFNFYELRGDGNKGQWYYRGDSQAIFADNTLLHRQPDAEHPQFGTRLRCSGCHGGGGPIMKELAAPHNDWWEPVRGLDFGGRVPDEQLQEILQTLVPADHLAQHVLAGMQKITSARLSLPEQLRPLFCPVEINLKSDASGNPHTLAIPADFFIDTTLLPEADDIVLNRHVYEAILQRFGSHFPETDLLDADHAWLTPVKSHADRLAIKRLIANGTISEKFAADVLATDMTNPVFSSTRCGLLRYVPVDLRSDWQQLFIANLNGAPEAAARELAQHLQDPERTPDFYRQRAQAVLSHCRVKIKYMQNIALLYRLLEQRRVEIGASEISKNPRGQILEPGFRIIFPVSYIQSLPGKLSLSINCKVLR